MENLDRIIVVFARPKEEIPCPIEQQMRQAHPSLPLEFIYYSPTQARVSKSVAKTWVYSWLSWCLGMAASRTQYCLLHDFDAMLVKPDIIESRYDEIRRRGVEYCGVRNYIGNGINSEDGLVVTFELMFDVAFVRRTFRPVELVNIIDIYKGRSVDFDSLLYIQTKAGKSVILEIAEEDMVHPQQVICQFTDLTQRKGWIPPESNNLLFVPYFLYVAGRPESLASTREELRQLSHDHLAFFGQQMDLSRLSVSHVDWISKQAQRLEAAVAGSVRADVHEYLSALRAYVERRASMRSSEHPEPLKAHA
jgi:hypothetical protein